MNPDDILALNNLQASGRVHPYTCPSQGDGNHREWNGDMGVLVATVRGWICPFCDYTQPFILRKESEKA